MNLFTAIWNLARRSGQWTMEELTRMEAYLWRLFYMLVGFVLFGLWLNLIDLKGWNLVFFYVSNLVLLIVAFDPVALATAGGVGAAVGMLQEGRGTAAATSRRSLELYAEILKYMMLWASIIFFFLSTWSFAENWKAFFVILAAMLVISLIKLVWKVGGDFGKRAIQFYATAMLVVSIITLVPGALWVKYMPFGWDPHTLGATPSEKLLYAIHGAEKEQQDQAESRVLDRILGKTQRGEPLTLAERAYLRSKETEQKGRKRPEASVAVGPPSTSSPADTWPVLTLSPEGRSEWLAVPPHTRIYTIGSDISFAVMYLPSGRVCEGASCADGDNTQIQIINRRKVRDMPVQNSIRYAFGPL